MKMPLLVFKLLLILFRLTIQLVDVIASNKGCEVIILNTAQIVQNFTADKK